MRQKILLMYITVRSGHYQAARAIEQGIRRFHPNAQVLSINAFQYLNPVLARIVDQMYLSVIQKLPELWDYLYDNPKIVRRSQNLRQLLHRYDSPRLRGLLEEFEPDAIACTQAFPCGLVADYKRQNKLKTPLYGIITDFSPHSYWVDDAVDGYIVAAQKTQQWLLDRKVAPSRVFHYGIPIDPVFGEAPDVGQIRRRLQISNGIPTVLLMGGGQGLGPMLEAVAHLDRLKVPMQLLAVAGTNTTLYHRLITRAPRLRHPIQVFGHVDFVSDLMSVSDLIITKPGGVTASEALAKGVAIIALNPIPGQEARNAQFLVETHAAFLAKRPEELPRLVQRLLTSPVELKSVCASAQKLGRPHSALETAKLILGN